MIEVQFGHITSVMCFVDKDSSCVLTCFHNTAITDMLNMLLSTAKSPPLCTVTSHLPSELCFTVVVQWHTVVVHVQDAYWITSSHNRTRPDKSCPIFSPERTRRTFYLLTCWQLHRRQRPTERAWWHHWLCSPSTMSNSSRAIQLRQARCKPYTAAQSTLLRKY